MAKPASFTAPGAIQSFRRKNGMNQATFWSRLGVTQSGGSRYENGRSIPHPVELLLDITYGTDRGSERTVEKLRNWKAPGGDRRG